MLNYLYSKNGNKNDMVQNSLKLKNAYFRFKKKTKW